MALFYCSAAILRVWIFGGFMFTYSRPSRRRVNTLVSEATAKQFKTGAWLLKIGQTVFVGIAVLSFVLLFQGK
jgi:hypothetical protein